MLQQITCGLASTCIYNTFYQKSVPVYLSIYLSIKYILIFNDHTSRRGIMLKNISLIIIIMFSQLSTVYASNNLSVSFVNPYPLHEFWRSVEGSMKNAAKDLGVKLRVYRTEFLDRFSYKSMALQAISDQPKYLVLQAKYGIMNDIMIAAQKKNVKIIVFNSGLSGADITKIGEPRDKYSVYLGSLLPDEVSASQLLTLELIKEARNRKGVEQKDKIEIIGINGSFETSVAKLRQLGLEKEVSKHNDVVINQIVPTNWTAEGAREKSLVLYKRYPKTSIFWTAAAILGMEVKKISDQVITGGFDWTSQTLEAIKDGTYVAAVGGHFMEGAWVLIMAHDHFHGEDFSVLGTNLSSKMSIITAHNNDFVSSIILNTEKMEQIDFKRFSRVYGLKGMPYQFDVNIALKSDKSSEL